MEKSTLRHQKLYTACRFSQVGLPHSYSFSYQVNKLTERRIQHQQIFIHNVSSESDEHCWKRVRLEMLARHAADRGNSDREIHQFRRLSSTSDAEMVGTADFKIPEIGCTCKISSGCVCNKMLRQNEFFRLLALSSTERDHHWPLQGLTKLYLFCCS